MNCHESRILLDRIVRDELTASEMESLTRHSEACSECAVDLAAALAVRRHAADLPMARQPARDLWPLVERRIVRRSPSYRWLAVAATILVVLSSAITLVITRSPAQTAARGDRGDAVAFVEASYLAESRSLERTLETERDRLSPETIRTLERNLAIIDAAIRDSRAALERDPGNRDLRILLEASHEQRIALLQQVSRVARDL